MGQLIALSGIDGVGKSTQVKRLVAKLQSQGKTVSFGESMFAYHLFLPLIRVARKATGSPQAGPVHVNRRLLPKLWFILAYLDIWVGYLFIIRPLLTKYDYVIADRYYSDIWANLLYYGYMPGWALVLVRGLPRADVALWLRADPATILKREQEFPDSYYYAQHAIYTQLAKLLPLQLIDANDTPNNVHNHILASLPQIAC